MNSLSTYVVVARRIIRCRVIHEWKYSYRWYWQANLRSIFEHYFWGHDCNTYRRAL